MFVAACRLSLVAVSRDYSLSDERASHFSGFYCGVQALEHMRALVARRVGLVALLNMGSSRTRDRTHVLCIDRQIVNHWITREVAPYFLKYCFRVAPDSPTILSWCHFCFHWPPPLLFPLRGPLLFPSGKTRQRYLLKSQLKEQFLCVSENEIETLGFIVGSHMISEMRRKWMKWMLSISTKKKTKKAKRPKIRGKKKKNNCFKFML